MKSNQWWLHTVVTSFVQFCRVSAGLLAEITRLPSYPLNMEFIGFSDF